MSKDYVKKFLNYMDKIYFGEPRKIKRKFKKICKKCFHKCHCDDELHSDRYGLCACSNCLCLTN